MYDILKKLLPVAEEIGTVETVNQTVKDPEYYDYDEIVIKGTTASGERFELTLEMKKETKDAS